MILTTLLLSLISSIPIYANVGEIKKESNLDLRKNSSKLIIITTQPRGSFELVENQGNFTIIFNEKEKMTHRKISIGQAQSLENNFAQKFIQAKYSLPQFKGKKCNMIYKLSLRTENFQICKGEGQKSDLAKELISDFKKYI